MINLDNVFPLFSEPENIDGSNDKVYMDITENPIYWIGMYKKTILNQNNFGKKIVENFNKIDPKLDPSDVKAAGEYILYNRAWYYISNINLGNLDHLVLLKQHSDEQFLKTLNMGMTFFEKYEEYEICAFLKKIYDFLNSPSS